MKLVIAGGTGFIGERLRKAAVSKGHEVVILSRHSQVNFPAVVWDAKSSGEWQSAIEKADAVVNLCGTSIVDGRWNMRQKKQIYDSRILPTRALVAALSQLKEKPKALINASAIGFYGDRADEELDESSKPGDDFLAKLCVDWEREALMAQSLGVRAVCLRIGLVFSRDGGALKRLALPFRFGLGGRLGSGRQWMSWIAMEDLLEMIFSLVDSEILGPVNAVSPNPIRNNDFALSLSQTLQRPAWISVPRWVLNCALGEVSSVVLSSQRAFPKKIVASGFKFQFEDLPSALNFSLK
jgi:hypothetical protein